MSRPARRASTLLLSALLSCVHAAPIAAMWRGDDAHCGCTSVICCCASRPKAPVRPAPPRSCHDAANSRDGTMLKCALPSTDLARPFVARGVLPVVASLERPARSGAALAPAVRAPLAGSLRLELQPPRLQLLVS